MGLTRWMARAGQISPFRLDAKAEILFRGTEPVALGRRAVALLRLLVERAGTPVSKETLIEATWPGLAIEESNLTVQIAALRRALDEQSDSATWIETLRGRGYRYVGPPIPLLNAPEPAARASSASVRPDRTSVAVLPFSNPGSDVDHEYFADGMVEDIITALSRFRSLLVIARNSSFAYRGKAVDIKQAGRELGVRYVVEGSVRRTNRELRVAVQLVDAESGYQLWSERYDRALADIFTVQDEIARAVVSTLPGRMEDAGRDIALRKQTSSMTAYDLVLLGNEQWRRLNRSGLAEAQERFRAAVALDPNYARAHANIAWTVVCAAFLETPAGLALDEALQEIETALDLDDDDAWSHGVFAQLLFLRNEDSRAERHFERALTLNPNDADVAAMFANILVYWGRWREALDWMATAKRLNPFPPNLYHWYHALALYSGRQYQAAIEALQGARSLHSWSLGLRAACHARLGMRAAARSDIDQFVRERHRELRENDEPVPADDLDLAATRAERYRHAADRKHFLDGLRKAGLGTTRIAS
ncbi:winged helix-turn-helix domain-containing protein [Reyranella sp.]|uniref:winged helix-turn-helix domain-containing tetratricopeptide repeat protein n=1 Tax=Reyranella sp. TaxID=1929291 RepID=UPI003455D323